MTSVLLGARLAVKGPRLRLAATALALAFAVAFLLAVLGALPARQAKLDRLAARTTVSAAEATPAGGTAAAASGVRVEGLFTWWRGRSITGLRVFGAGPGDPAPPGLDRLPAPGELAVSPELAAVLSGPHATELATRLPGRVTQVVRAQGLSGPRELYAVVGLPAVAEAGVERAVVTGFGLPTRPAPVSAELRTAAQLGALGLLLPVLVLVATATRLSAATRDVRLAAIRLVGASPRQVAALAAGEGLVLGLLGTALGGAVFLLLRPLAARLVPVDGGVFAADLVPPAGQTAAVVVAVPVLAVLAALVAMRRVLTSPLEVRRSARSRRPAWWRAGWWRLVPLAAGLSLLAGLWGTADEHFSGSLLLSGGTLTVLGLALAAPAISRLAGVLLGRLPGVSASLASRRVAADPAASARALTGMVLVVFLGVWLMAFLPLLQSSQGSEERELARLLPPSTLVAHGAAGLDVERVRRAPGVRAALRLGETRVSSPRRDGAVPADDETPVIVGRCSEVRALLRLATSCGGALVHQVQLDDARAENLVPRGVALKVRDGWDRVAGTVVLPDAAPDLRLPWAAQGLGLYAGSLLVDPSLLPTAATGSWSSRLVVVTDGRPDSVERVRAALPIGNVFGARTLAESLKEQDRVVLGYQRAVRLGLLLALLVGTVSLVVTVVDELSRRRRDLAALVAFGVPRRVLRRAVLLQSAAPVVANAAVAVAAGAFAAAAYVGANEASGGTPTPLPWDAWGAIGVTGAALVLAVTALTLPLVTSACRPEHLRTG